MPAAALPGILISVSILNLNSSSSQLISRSQLRRQLRHLRRNLTQSQQQQAAWGVLKQFRAHAYYRQARHIAVYQAADGELDLNWLIKQMWQDQKTVYLPVLPSWPKTKMLFQPVTADTHYQKNRFGLWQPQLKPTQQRAAWALDLVLMPLVGFDQAGNRLGMGGGFYDRVFATQLRPKRPRLVGVAHACQQVEQLTVAAWDVPLDAVLTEQSVILCSRGD